MGQHGSAHDGTYFQPRERRELDNLGLVWNTRDTGWEAMLAELTRYKECFGHCAVPPKWSENPHSALG